MISIHRKTSAWLSLGASLVAALVGQSAFGQGTSGTWTTAGNGTWSTTSNWSGGTVANGAGALANFGTVDLTVSSTVTLDTNRTIGRLIFGDTGWTSSTSLFNWTLQSGTLTLDNTGGTGGNPPSITINTGTTTISSVLAGSNGLSLAMPWSNYDDTRGTSVAAGNDMNSQTTGGLTFTGSNTLSGTLSATGGTVRVGGSAGRLGSVTALSVTGNGTFLNGDATAATNNSITNRIGDGTATLSLGGSSGGGVYTSAFAASGTTSQTFARLTINAGQNAINTANTAAGTNNLIFTGGTNGAGYVRNVNGIVNVVPATGFNPQFTNAPTAAGGSSVSGSGGNEILIGALLGGTDFIRATSGTLVAATYTTNGATSLTAGANINITGTNTTLSGSTTLSVNSIKFTDNAARTLDLGTGSALTVTSGGILTGTAVATTGNTITGGSITSGQSDLWIYANGSTLGNPRVAGNALTIASKVTGNISVTVGGGSGPTVAGQQVVFSNASNDYAGGTFLVGGVLSVGADGALGSTSGTVTAVSGLNYLAPTASFTFNANRNFVVNSGAALFIGDRGQTNTIAGNLSGGGQFGPGYVSNGQRLNLTGSNSGFTGQYMVNGYLGATEGTSLSSNANLMFTGRDQLNLGVLETSGTFSRALGSGAGQVQWQNRSGYGGGGFAAVGGALTVNIGGNVTPDTLTFASGYFIPANGALNLGTSVSTADLTFLNPINLNGAQRAINVTAAGTTKATMSGVISGNASSGILKADTGTLVLSGSNTYQGKTTIAQGTLSVATIGSVSGTGNLGAPTTAANATIDLGAGGGGGLNNAGLTYTGSGETTDRVLNMLATIGQITLTQSGTGLLKFTSNVTSGAMRPTDMSTALILAGSTSGTGEISGIIADTTMTGTVTVAASTGATTLTIPAGSLSVSTGWQRANILVSGSGIAPGSRWTAFNQTTNVGTLNVATTADIAANQAITLTGVNSIQKTGTGTWVLSGNNTYTGPTTVSAGVLSVSSLANGGSSSNIGASTNAAGNLVLGGGSLQYTGATVTTDRAFTLTASTTSTIDVSTAGTTLTFTGSTTATTGALTKAGAGTLALAGAAAYTGATAINAGTLQIGNGGTTGGLSASSAISIASGATLAFSRTDNYGGNFGNTITGSGALTLLSGSLTFSTAKTYTGPTTVSGGVLAAGIANAFGSSAPLAVNSGTVNLAGFSQAVGALSGSAGTLITTSTAAGSATLTTTLASGTSTFAGSIANNVSGTVAFTKAGAGTQVLSGNNTYTGTTSVTAGTLQIGNGSTTGALSASSVITGSTGATLAFNRTDNYGGNVANTIGGGLGLSLLSGSLTLSATNTYTGDTSINSGRLEIASTGRLDGGTYAGAITNNGAFVYSGTNSQTLSGLITGSGAFTNNAASTVTISGTMSLSGASNAISTTTNGAIDLTAQLSTAPGSLLTFTVGGGASTGPIRLYGASNTIQGEVLVTGGSGAGSSLVWLNTSGVNSLSGATKITVASGNTLRYWSASVGAGTAFDLNGTGNNFRGALSFYDSGTSTLSGAVNLSGNSQILSRNASLTLAGNVTESGGARSLTITADGGGATTQVYTLSGSNSFSGGLTLNGGDFAGFSAKLVAGSATAFGSGPLALNSLTQATATAVVDLNGQAITVGGLSGGNLANANSFIQSDSGAAVLTVNQATNDTFSGVIRNGSGSVGLTKSGAATLTLSGSNTYTGQTTVNGGVLAAGAANAFGSSAPLAVNSGTVNLAGFSQSVGALSGSAGGVITTSAAAGTTTLTTTFASGTSTFAGSIANNVSGTVAFTKAGAGTQILSGTNTFSGATSIAAGVLSINGTSALQGTSGLTIAGGAGLTYTGGAATFSKPVTVTAGSGTGTIWNSGGGLLTLAGNLSKDNSVLRLAGGAFNVTGTISGATVGASDLVVAGTSSVTLSAANTYNGPTFVIESSTLAYGINSAIPSNSVVTLGNASSQGTLSMNGFTGAIGGLAFGSAGGTLRLAATSTSAAPLTAASGTMTLTNGTLDLAGSGSTAGLYRVLSAQSIGGSFASITGTSAAYQVITSATSVDYQQRAVLGAVTVTNPAVSIITGGSAAFTYTVANSALSGGASLAFTGANLSNVTGSSSGSVAAAGTSSSVSGLFFNGTTVGSGQQGTFTVSAPSAYGATTATGTVSVNVLDHSNAAFALASGGGQTIITGGTFAGVGFNLTNAGSNRSAVQVNSLTNLVGGTGTAVVLSGGTGSYTASILDTTTIGTGTLSVGMLAGDQQSLSGASALQSLTSSATYTVLDHALPGFLATGIADPYAQATLNIDFGTIDEGDGVQSFTFSLINLASQSYGAGLTAGLDFTSVTPNGDGFASGLSTFTNLVGGGTSSLYTFTYTPSGQGTFSKNFTLSFTDNQNLSGAAVRRDLTISAQVIVVPEPGTLALAGLGIALVGWAVATRRRQQTP